MLPNCTTTRYERVDGIEPTASAWKAEVLPLSQYTLVWWTASFQSIMNFIELRDEKTAQWEIQQYAKALKQIMLEVFPETTKIWKETYWK